MRLLTALKWELVKLFWRPSAYIGYVVILVVVPLVAAGAKHIERHSAGGPLRRGLGDDFVVAGNIVNGPLLAYVVLGPSLIMLLPVLATIVSSSQVAGERYTGVLRMLLVRPVSRTTVLLSKFIVSALHAATLALVLGGVSFGLGYVLWGGGNLAIPEPPFREFTGVEVYQRLGLAYALAGCGLVAMSSIALLFSVLVRNPAAAAGMAVAFLLLSAIAEGVFQELDWHAAIPYLINHHIVAFRQATEVTIPTREVVHSLLALGLYTVIPFLIGLVVFERKDVLC